MKLLEVPEDTVEQALSQMLTGGSLLLEEIDGEPLVFLPHLRKAEEGIAAKIRTLGGDGSRSTRRSISRRPSRGASGRPGKTLAPASARR